MIVSCPECGARYKLADDAIPAEGRAMRCASCKHRWFELGPEPDSPPIPPPLVLTPEVDEAEPPARALDDGADGNPDDDALPERRGHPVLKTILALVLGAAFSAGAAAMWIPDLPPLDLAQVPWLADIVDPPRPAPNPLAVAFVAAPQPVAGGRTLYALTGTVENRTSAAHPVPVLEGRLVDAAGRVDYRWRIPLKASVLLPGQSLGFDASALGAPGARVVVAH